MKSPFKGKGSKIFTQKFKDFVEKKNLSHQQRTNASTEQEVDEKPTPDEGPKEQFVFIPADKSLDIVLQTRENLGNFKSFLESKPDDPTLNYDAVYQTLSQAFGELTNDISQSQERYDQSLEESKELEKEINEKEKIRNSLEKQIRELNYQVRQLKSELFSLKEETELFESKLESTKHYKSTRNKLGLLYQDLLSQKIAGNSLYENSKMETQRLEELLQRKKKILEETTKQSDNEIQKSEVKIKSLTNEAKRADQREKELQSKPKVDSYVDDSSNTFIIDDNVKVSPEEIKQLKLMVESIQQENANLIAERDSKMMDIDCIMQENLGLKQIIRKMTEGES